MGFYEPLKKSTSRIQVIYLQCRLLFKAAELSNANGNAKDAVEYIERAISIEGPSREDLGTLMRSAYMIGKIFLDGGKYSKAKHYFLIGLQILNDRNGIFYEEIEDIEVYDEQYISELEDATAYGVTFNNLALIYIKQGNYDEALEYYEKALVIKEEVLGKAHPSTATTYNNMGILFYYLEHYESAKDYFEKAIAIFEKSLGANHLYTKIAKNGLDAASEKLDN